MVLSTMRVDAISPRGAVPTVEVTITGEGFGAPTGTLTLDPLAQAINIVPTSWTNDEIVFEVPAVPGDLRDKTVMLSIVRQDQNDSVQMPFWIPATNAAANDLDYQYPNFEEGSPKENEDDPRLQTAADFNRLFDRVKQAAASPLPPLIGEQYAVLMENPIGVPSWSVLTEDMIGAAFAVGLALVGSATREVGESAINPQFNASYTRPPAAAVLTDDDPGSTPLDVVALANPITRVRTYVRTTNNEAVTFTLTANETGGPSRTGTAQIAWRPRAFWGVGPAGGGGEAFIEALASSALAANRTRSFSLTAGPTEKIYYAYPAAYGLGTFAVGGFVGGFLPPSTVAVTNPFGVTQNYYLYESTNVGLGSTTVDVS